ncbi:glycoside hydrolase domain-containing protein [Arthrobacter sp. HY1533]|uniref:glycoside hydrolase domain-containing protein n=1 Tax=Arthrobacter sp. HY1533 TaxID=2970919 RepID=UPI0022B9FE91|nr:glycoside hydrolase domain-containing protein [Arthrobacter sp. HY1533]
MPTPAPATSAPSTPAQLHPELECGLGSWDKLLYGNHRIVVAVPDLPQGCRAATAILPWRRQDATPAEVDTIVISAASGTRVRNVVAGEKTQAKGTFTFEPIDGPGEYHFYYLPYVMGGHSYYPQAQYLPARPTADPAWVNSVADSVWSFELGFHTSHPVAKAIRYEAASEWDSFAPMNFTATEEELAALHGAHAGASFLLFAQDRRHPISMKNAIPAHWAIAGPDAVAGAAVGQLVDQAQPGEDHIIQLGLYARTELADVTVDIAAHSGGAEVAARCINTAGVDRLGRPFSKTLQLADGAVQALYVVVPVPESAAGSTLDAVITVASSAGTAQLPVRLEVAPEAEPDVAAGGFGDPRELRRLAWLDSTLAQDDELVAPYTAVRIDEAAAKLEILGRTVQLAPNGLPEQLSSTFTSAVTAVDGPSRALLREPLTVLPQLATAAAWEFTPLAFTTHGPARVGWTCGWSSPDTPLAVTVEGQLEADGAATFAVRLSVPQGAAPVELADVALTMVLDPESVPYAMGLGVPGGTRPAAIDWHWDVPTKNQDSLWLGDANIGVQLALRDDNYERPLNTNFYQEKPLIAPQSWANPEVESAGAGVTLKEVGGGTVRDAVVLEAKSGGRTMVPGAELNYGFRLLLTPFKPIDPSRQLRNRYFHDQGSVADIAATGASVINIHHATALAPFINDPLLHADALAEYTAQAHAAGIKVKVYDTVRELTGHSPDLLPMMSLGHEIFSDGPGKGHIWPQEHAGANYVSAWYAPTVDDIAVVTAGESRLQNWYIRGLDELVRRTGLDGIYLDDIAYDREAMKRVRKVLAARCPEPEIDIHSANQFNEKDGFASSSNMYMEQLPYTDRLWLGEYFDYDNTDPAYWLVEVSGIPFGLMGEMLEGGGNPWRGLVFAMTGRAPRVDNRALWELWAEHGLAEAPMVGHWALDVPVRSSHPEVLATSWITPSGLVTALASWAPEPVSVTLEFAPEFAHLAAAPVVAPSVDGFQEAVDFAPGAAITVEPRKGVVLVVNGH